MLQWFIIINIVQSRILLKIERRCHQFNIFVYVVNAHSLTPCILKYQGWISGKILSYLLIVAYPVLPEKMWDLYLIYTTYLQTRKFSHFVLLGFQSSPQNVLKCESHKNLFIPSTQIFILNNTDVYFISYRKIST